MMQTSQEHISPGGASVAKQFTSRTLHIKPNETKQMPLGSYSKTEPKPEFKVTTRPDIDEQLGASLESMDIPGGTKYISFYHLHNYSQKGCDVTVIKIVSNKKVGL